MAEIVVDKIVYEIDQSTLLGAAYDCMTESEKYSFRKKLKNLLNEAGVNYK